MRLKVKSSKLKTERREGLVGIKPDRICCFVGAERTESVWVTELSLNTFSRDDNPFQFTLIASDPKEGFRSSSGD